jgi:heat shock protein HtpX
VIKNSFKTILLLGVLSAILIVIGGLVSPGMLWFFGALAVLLNLGAYFFSDKLVLKMNRARPVSEQEAPKLHRIVAELADKAGLPKPKVYVVDDPAPNAFATGRNPKNGVVAVTTGIQQLLTERELRGVIAHELAHIRNRDILVATIAAMIAAIIAMIASVIKWGAIFGFGRGDDDDGGGNILVALALAIIAPIAATVVQLAISRSREYGADATGARISGDPMALADALAKLDRGNKRIRFRTIGDNPATASLFICSPLSGQSVTRLFSTHPPISERIKRLAEIAAE